MTGKSTTSQQIIEALTENKVQLAEMARSMKTLGDGLSEIQRTLRGSEGSSGLVGRLETLERSEKDCIVNSLEKIITGDGKDPGLVDRTRKIEEFQTSLKRWFYLMFSAILVDFVVRLWPELAALVK